MSYLSGCASCWEKLKDQVYVYDLDMAHGVCGKNRVTSFNPFHVVWIEDLPLASCDGYFALSPMDQQRIKNCINDSIEECKR